MMASVAKTRNSRTAVTISPRVQRIRRTLPFATLILIPYPGHNRLPSKSALSGRRGSPSLSFGKDELVPDSD